METRRKSSQVIADRSPSSFHKNSGYFPTGYSLQTGKVHSTWQDFDRAVKTLAERQGEGVSYHRDGDFTKLRGTRYKYCCEATQEMGIPCQVCGIPVGYK